jgi:hypothetical protein
MAKIKCLLRFSVARNRPKSPNFSTRLKYVAKNFIYSYFACNQIGLNLGVDHHHFGYIAKFTQKNTTPKLKVFYFGEGERVVRY